jgi:phosphatidate cytidylyltransferase
MSNNQQIETIPKRIKKSSNLAQRIFTALTAGSALVSLIIVSPWGLFGACVLISILGLLEFYKLIDLKIHRWETIFTLAFTLFVWGALAISLYQGKIRFEFIAVGVLALPAISIILLYEKAEKTAVQTLSLLSFSQLYIVLPFLLFFISAFDIRYRAFSDYHFEIPLGILLLHWLSDTAAYFAGRMMGRRSLFPRISPKKTWEGFAGGLIGNLLLGWLFEIVWNQSAFNWIVIAFIIAVMGLYGDLVESMIKRNLNVKDSGSILPGHGGILDRFDSFLMAMPAVFVVQLLFGN